MKKLLFLFLFIPALTYSQDEFVTNLNLKKSTINFLIDYTRSSNDTATAQVFLKWRDTIRVNNPSENANVQIDTIGTQLLANLYQVLRSLPSGLNDIGGFLADFKTSITPKRNTNTLLDDLCTAIEDSDTQLIADIVNRSNAVTKQ